MPREAMWMRTTTYCGLGEFALIGSRVRPLTFDDVWSVYVDDMKFPPHARMSVGPRMILRIWMEQQILGKKPEAKVILPFAAIAI